MLIRRVIPTVLASVGTDVCLTAWLLSASSRCRPGLLGFSVRRNHWICVSWLATRQESGRNLTFLPVHTGSIHGDPRRVNSPRPSTRTRTSPPYQSGVLTSYTSRGGGTLCRRPCFALCRSPPSRNVAVQDMDKAPKSHLVIPPGFGPGSSHRKCDGLNRWPKGPS